MTSLCTNPTGCDAFRASYQRGQNECTGCGGNLAPLRQHRKLFDDAIDELCNFSALTGEEFFHRIAATTTGLRERLLTELGVDEPLASVNLSLQFRMAETIQELKETIRRGH